jgi:hypothetical protein
VDHASDIGRDALLVRVTVLGDDAPDPFGMAQREPQPDGRTEVEQVDEEVREATLSTEGLDDRQGEQAEPERQHVRRERCPRSCAMKMLRGTLRSSDIVLYITGRAISGQSR